MNTRNVICVFALVIVFLFINLPAAEAQANLLTNPGLEDPYSGPPMRATAYGWSHWVGAGNPDFYPEQYGSVFAGARSQAILGSWSTFTAAVYQSVPNVPVGATVRASAWGQLFVGISTNPAGTNSQMRVGIDPNGGTNPYDSDVVWSGTLSSTGPATVAGQSLFTAYTQLTVEARATGGSVTIFLWGSQTWAAAEHRQFWDNASLIVVGATSAPPSANTSANTSTGRTLAATTALNVRSGPGTTYNRLGTIYPGVNYAITGEQSSWYEIDYNGTRGYVYGGFVTVSQGQAAGNTTPVVAPTGITFTSIYNLNLRSGPSGQAARIGTLPHLTTVSVVGREASNTWVQVNYNGLVGWVAWWLGWIEGGGYDAIPVTG